MKGLWLGILREDSRRTEIVNKSNVHDAVAEWYGAGLCDREVAGSTPARGCCVPTPTQRAIPPGSVNEYQQKLRSKRAYHVMH